MNSNFTVIETRELAYRQTEVTHLVHNPTGFQIIYFKWPRKLNHFAFNFLVPVTDDSGASHILEHCILNGSEKYPVHDLIKSVGKVSPSTYMNACTRDKATSFMASTYVEKDFYNLLDIYGDAVFFPLLRQEVFDQEGWHWELDEKGNPVIKGVVYNEENSSGNKNARSFIEFKRKFLKGSDNLNSAGGFPECIPEVTREKIVEIHKKYYVPSNCMLVLCDNLPLDDQLDFLETNLLYKLPSVESIKPKSNFITPITKKTHYTVECDYEGNKNYDLTYYILSKDGTPEEIKERDDFYSLFNTILEDKLSQNPYGLSGNSSQAGMKDYKLFNVSITNVERKNLRKAEKYIEDLFQFYYENGFPEDKLNVYIRGVDLMYANLDPIDFNESAVVRAAVSGWVDTNNPISYFEDEKANWEIEKAKYLSPDAQQYLKKMIKKYILDQKHVGVEIAREKKNFLKKIDKKIQKTIKKYADKADKAEIQKRIAALNAYMNEPDNEAILSKLPSIPLSDLPIPKETIPAKYEEVQGKYGPVRLYHSEQPLPNRAGVEIVFPTDVLEEEEYRFICNFPCLLNSFGFGEYSWAESIDILDNSDIHHLSRTHSGFLCTQYGNKDKQLDSRSWLSVSFMTTISQFKKSLEIVKSYIYEPNISKAEDMERFSKKMKRYFDSCMYGCEETFAEYAARANLTSIDAFNNEIDGVNSLELIKKLKNESTEALVKRYFDIYTKIINSGAVLNVFTCKEKIQELKEMVKDFIVSSEIKPLSEKIFFPEEVELKEGKVCCTAITNDNSAGSMVMFLNSSPYPSKECVAENAVLKWLNNNDFHSEVRSKNGAYYIHGDSIFDENLLQLRTVQDPTPAKSIAIIEEVLERTTRFEFTDDIVKNLILSIYSSAYAEITAKEQGEFDFRINFIGLRTEHRNTRLENLLQLTGKDLHEAAIRIYEASKNSKIGVVTGDESQIVGDVIFDSRTID